MNRIGTLQTGAPRELGLAELTDLDIRADLDIVNAAITSGADELGLSEETSRIWAR